MQLRFASFAVINLREDLHLRECARAERTMKKPASRLAGFLTSQIQISGIALLRLSLSELSRWTCRLE